MRAINPSEVWLVDFELAAKVRPARLPAGNPADDELDLVTGLRHTAALRGNRWELSIPKPLLKPGAFHLQQIRSIPNVRRERKLGALASAELDQVPASLAERPGS